MAKNFNELFGSSINNTPENNCLFNDVCPTGYFKKAELIGHLNALSADDKQRWQLKHLDLMFKFMKTNSAFTREPQHTTDDGIELTWLNLTVGRVKRSIKILHFADIKTLIDDYSNGSVRINQNLEELYEEAID
jgi:hypothetical protein